MLIELLKNDPIIKKYICNACAENGIEVKIDPAIDPQRLLIIKVDDFYNSEVTKPDCSPDCLIIQKCNGHFDVFVVELRNVRGPKGIKVAEIQEKFITCLDDFMSHRFGNHFYHDEVTLNKLKLFFITDPFGFLQNPEKQLRIQGHKLDFLMSIRIPKFFNKYLYIEHHLPNPTIKNCA